jgi:hypothetical protein
MTAMVGVIASISGGESDGIERILDIALDGLHCQPTAAHLISTRPPQEQR